MLIFNNYSLYTKLGLLRFVKGLNLQNLTAYFLLLKLLFFKFNKNFKILKFIGIFKTRKYRKPFYALTKFRRSKKRQKTIKKIQVRKKMPYFYSNQGSVSKGLYLSSKLQSYKQIWSSGDFFEMSNVATHKRYSTFSSKNRMLSGVLRQSIGKSFKRNLAKYSYKKEFYRFQSRAFNQHKVGISNLIDFKLLNNKRKLKPVFFKKRFFKTLIGSRHLLSTLLKCKSKNKKGVINLISTNAHTTFYERMLRFELSAFNLVLKSRFTTSIKDSYFWVASGSVFINGRVTTNPYKQVLLNDRLQLPISNRYYQYKKLHTIRATRDIAKLKAKVYLKNRGKFNLFRRKSYLWPSWTLRTAFFKCITPCFLEVDYLTLTSVLVYLPKNILEFDSVIWKFVNIHNYRLYNWKLIN